jgi:hypothetical protein
MNYNAVISAIISGTGNFNFALKVLFFSSQSSLSPYMPSSSALFHFCTQPGLRKKREFSVRGNGEWKLHHWQIIKRAMTAIDTQNLFFQRVVILILLPLKIM